MALFIIFILYYINSILLYVSKMRMIPEIKDTHEIYFDSFWHPLSEIKYNIRKLSTNVGFPSIKIAIEIMMNDEFNINNKEKNLLDIYNYIFLPVKYIEKTAQDNAVINFDLYTEHIYFREGNLENIFVPNFELYIKKDDDYLVLKGIFIPDEISLFMRSSIIVFNQLFLKRKHIESMIDGELGKNLMRGLSLGEIIVYSPDKIKELINANIIKYNIIKYKNPQTIFKETVNKNNIGEFYNILKILLAGEEENYQLAGFLCSLAKDKKYNDYSLSDVIISYIITRKSIIFSTYTL